MSHLYSSQFSFTLNGPNRLETTCSHNNCPFGGSIGRNKPQKGKSKPKTMLIWDLNVTVINKSEIVETQRRYRWQAEHTGTVMKDLFICLIDKHINKASCLINIMHKYYINIYWRHLPTLSMIGFFLDSLVFYFFLTKNMCCLLHL